FRHRSCPAYLIQGYYSQRAWNLSWTNWALKSPGVFCWEDIMLNETAIAALKSDLRGELIEPNDTRYDAMRKVYNSMMDRRPRLIARCADVADVITAVKFGREHTLPLSVRS